MTHHPANRRSPVVLAAFWILVIATSLSLIACRSESLPAGGAGTKPTTSVAATAAATGSAAPAASGTKEVAAPGTIRTGAPLDDQGRMQVGADDRCPVCAMRVKAHAKFASALTLDDGRTYYFCGTGCLLRTWLHPRRFLGVERKRLDRAVVREYFKGKHLDAATVVWVAGSDVVGPMGPAIVPLADDEAATTFKQRHGGKTTFQLAELTDEKWEQMTGKKAAR